MTKFCMSGQRDLSNKRLTGLNPTLLLAMRFGLLLSVFSLPYSFVFGNEQITEKEFVGSEACRDCHESIYAAWRTTFHSFSMRTPEQAQAANLPLPPLLNSSPAEHRRWSEISTVFGGRNRLTYIDHDGAVIQPGFDARLQRWDQQFPDGHINSCWTCHATGNVSAGGQTEDYASHKLELTIGCESCHGAGSRHVETFEARDIVVDTGSRSCGRCHTGAGRVLPAIDHHRTHDFVQQWHKDAHVRGLADYTTSAHCASCHSPADASQTRPGGSNRIVFSDRKKDIGCPSCHDPHRMTNPAYTIKSATSGRAQLTALSVLRGRDGDFTTNDHDSQATTEASCRACHRGADRVVINHGNATCVDCHSGFHRTRGKETRVVADPNHSNLSCRGCHVDGDHLLTIVSSDRRFLFPKIVHNLNDLPDSARTDFELRGASYGTVARDISVERLHVAAAADPAAEINISDISPKSGTIANDPLNQSLRQAVEALTQGTQADVATVLRKSARLGNSELLLALPIDHQDPNRGSSETLRLLQRLQAQRPPLDSATQAWLDALGATLRGDLAAVIRIGESIDASERGTPLNVLVALAHSSRGNARRGVRLLERRALELEGNHLIRVTLALLEFRRNRHRDALSHLESVLKANADDALAYYVRGLVLAGTEAYPQAVNAVGKAVALIPQWRDAWLKLGYLLIRAQETNRALGVLQQTATTWPRDHATRYRLGSLYKLLADQMRYQLIASREAPRPQGAMVEYWHRSLNDREEQIRRIAALAHAEYTFAQQLRPADYRTQWQRAEALRIMGRDDEALQLFETLGARAPNQWAPKYRAGLILLKQSKPQHAAVTLTRAHRLQPDQADVLGALGYAYLELDEPMRSLAYLELARVFEPFNPAIHHNLGVAHARSGATSDAEHAWRRGIELGTFPLPRVHLTHFNLGLLYYQQDKHESARKELDRALFSFPDFEPARQLRQSIDDNTEAAVDYVLHLQTDMFGEISTVSGFDLAP